MRGKGRKTEGTRTEKAERGNGMDARTENQLRNAKYGVFGHSAVQICGWTKKSLHNQGVCYKEKFYGADCHRCMEFSPAAVFCEQNCIFCWRPMEFMKSGEMEKEGADEPEEIYERLLEERRKLLSGFPGDGMTDPEKFREALRPNHFAISLSGEPMMYPKLPGLVRFLRGLPGTRTIFIVTNGQEPGMLERLVREDSLPTQLYLSVNAPDREVFGKICRPARKDAWERFQRFLEVYRSSKTRKIMRLTMIKGMNMDPSFVDDYAKIIRKANPHFIEVKAYMWLGFSQKRLKRENMPSHREVREFAERIEKAADFRIIDEQEASRIVLLQNTKDAIDPEIKSVKWEERNR